VPNQLAGDDSSFRVDLRFKAMADFRPESVVRQVEPLSQLLEARNKLADCATSWPATTSWKICSAMC
jgi:type VI secretion system protein ImpB